MRNFSNSIQIKWYISYEILVFEKDDTKLQTAFLVWENLILIEADSPEEALDKAISHGKLSGEELLIDDEKGYCRFKGIRKLVPIYDELVDGVEIEWHEFESTKDQLRRMIPPKKKLQAFQPLTNFEN